MDRKYSIPFLALCLVASVLTPSSLWAGGHQYDIAVIDFTGTDDLPPPVIEQMNQSLMEGLGLSGNLKVLPLDQVNASLEAADRGQLKECRSADCVNEIGEIVDARVVVSTMLIADDTLYMVSMKSIDTESAQVVTIVDDDCMVCTVDEGAAMISKVSTKVAEESREAVGLESRGAAGGAAAVAVVPVVGAGVGDDGADEGVEADDGGAEGEGVADTEAEATAEAAAEDDQVEEGEGEGEGEAVAVVADEDQAGDDGDDDGADGEEEAAEVAEAAEEEAAEGEDESADDDADELDEAVAAADVEEAAVEETPAAPVKALVTFDSAPYGAIVLIDGEELGASPMQTSLDAGEYKVRFEREGYFAHEETVSVSGESDSEFTVTAVMEPAPLEDAVAVAVEEEEEAAPEETPAAPVKALVTFDSAPYGAIVLIDGEELGASPMQTSLDAGEYKVRFEREGYFAHEETVSVSGESDSEFTVTAVMEPAPLEDAVAVAVEEEEEAAPVKALVTFDSAPYGAIVSIDGEEVGASPTKSSLVAGEYKVRFEREGYFAYEETVSVSAERGSEFTVTAVMEPAPLEGVAAAPVKTLVNLDSAPYGAAVFVDGEEIGVSPMQTSLAAGEYKVRFESDGFVAYEETVSVPEGGAGELAVTAVMEPAPLEAVAAVAVKEEEAVEETPAEEDAPVLTVVTLDSTPHGAFVLIDGEELGYAPMQTSLAAGEYKVRFEREGFVAHEETVSVSADGGSEIALNVVLESEAEEAVAVAVVPVGVVGDGEEVAAADADGVDGEAVPEEAVDEAVAQATEPVDDDLVMDDVADDLVEGEELAALDMGDDEEDFYMDFGDDDLVFEDDFSFEDDGLMEFALDDFDEESDMFVFDMDEDASQVPEAVAQSQDDEVASLLRGDQMVPSVADEVRPGKSKFANWPVNSMVIAGGASGIAAAILGGVLMGMNDTATCGSGPIEQCPTLYDTKAGGVASLGVGGALVAGAAALFLLAN